ncbi:MAG: 6-phosphogluconolactonase [Candidatus Woesearchaeota archaeon]
MKTITPQDVSTAFVQAIQEVLTRKPICYIGVCGGRSVQAFIDTPLPQNVVLFMIDERYVALEDSLRNDVLWKQANIQRMSYETSVQHSAQTYTDLFFQHTQAFDIVVASAGEDGHIASLYPYHDALQIDKKRFVAINDSPKPPAQRITATMPLLQTATHAFLCFIGEAKAKAYQHVTQRVDIKQCPAVGLLTVPNVIIVKEGL